MHKSVGRSNYTEHPPEVIHVPIRTPEDLFKLPEPIKRRIRRELEIEELEEFLRARGEK